MPAVQCKSCGYDNLPEARFCANCGSSLAAIPGQTVTTPAPSAELEAPAGAGEYMGFWIRFGAAFMDGIVVCIVGWLVSSMLSILLLSGIFGFGYSSVVSLLFLPVPWLYYWLFTGLKGQTLGKMAVGIKVVNAAGSVPGLGTAALREIPGKIISSVVVFVGFLWIIWDGRKQSWHDKIARTYVVKVQSRP